MALTYSYDPTVMTGPQAVVNKIRRLAGDTDTFGMTAETPRSERTAIWSDQDLLGYLADTGDSWYAAALALEALAQRYAVMAVGVDLGGGGNINYGSVSALLAQRAKDLIDRLESMPAEAISENDWNDFSLRRIYANSALRQLP